jgi:transcriptional regulator with XRE-family HTH domain/tetratricopeptide (TPR) repeat protein
MTRAGSGRVCVDCGQPLSRYNPESRCQACVSSAGGKSRITKSDAPTPAPRDDVQIGSRLARLRRDRGLTQEQLAESASLSVDTVRKLEQQAKSWARLDTLSALALALSISIGELVQAPPRQPNNASIAVPLPPGKEFAKRKRLPDYLPADVLARPDFAKACAERDLGAIFRLMTNCCGVSFTISHLARRCEMTSSQVQDYMTRGRLAQKARIFERVADGLHVPGDMLGVGRRPWEAGGAQRDQPPVSATRPLIDIERSVADRHMRKVPSSPERADSKDVANASEKLAEQISELVTWTEATNVGSGTLSHLHEATLRLAHDCLSAPPIQSHQRADVLTRRIFGILRTGRQKIGQTRDLYVTAGRLCAVLSWVVSDLGQLTAAETHSRSGWTLADEADCDGLRALLLCAQSKNAFWAKRYDDAARYARRGYEYKPSGTSRVLLACQEADAHQASGRVDDAREALDRAQRAQDSLRGTDEIGGIFACGTARHANYSIATYLRVGAVKRALQQVERAETAWRDGEDWAYGTWAQVQIGAAIAYLMNGEIEAAAGALRPLITDPAARHLATLTTRLRSEVTPLLAGRAIGQSKTGITLRDEIAHYCTEQSRSLPLPAGGNYTHERNRAARSDA